MNDYPNVNKFRNEHRRSVDPDRGYLARHELPYPIPTPPIQCVHWLLGANPRYAATGPHAYGHCGPGGSMDGHGAGFDHARAMNTPAGRVIFGQPGESMAEYLAEVQPFLAQWGLDAHPVAESVTRFGHAYSGVLFVRPGVEVADVVATLRERWLALVPGATVPRFPDGLMMAHPAGRARTPREVAGSATGGRA